MDGDTQMVPLIQAEARQAWNLRSTSSQSPADISFQRLFRPKKDSAILSRFAALRCRRTTEQGKVAEWSNALDSKSSVRLYRTVGSNPTLSARIIKHVQDVSSRFLAAFFRPCWIFCLPGKLIAFRSSHSLLSHTGAFPWCYSLMASPRAREYVLAR